MYNKKRNKVYNSSEINTNEVGIVGDVVSAPELSHTIYNEGIYLFYVSVNRLSNYADKIPIMISDRLVDISLIHVGSKVSISGQLRSLDKKFKNSTSIKLFVFVTSIDFVSSEEDYDDYYINSVKLSGYVCKPPTYRITSSDRCVSDIVLAVNRKYGKSDYIFCIAWGRNARFSNEQLKVGSYIELTGRIQSREFVKYNEDGFGELRNVYEVSISTLSDGVL